MKKEMVVLTVITLTILLVGCITPSPVVSPCKDAPDWVYKGGDAFKDKAFYAVGSTANASDPHVRRKTAEQRARAGIANIFNTEIEDLTDIYARSLSTGNIPGAESAEQFLGLVTTAFTKMTLSGVKIVDHFFCPSENTMYALAKLDVDGFKEEIGKVKDLPDQVKQSIINNADDAFEKLKNFGD